MTVPLLDTELRELDAQVRLLGSLVDGALARALGALQAGDQDEAGAVVVSDTQVDDLHLAIEERAFRALARRQQLAGHSLRFLAALAPISIDLERIGDEAEAIAQNVLRMTPLRAGEDGQAGTTTRRGQGGMNLLAPVGEREQASEAAIMRALLALGQRVRTLLQETMRAFADRDAAAARRLWEQDRGVDRGSYAVRREVLAMLDGKRAIASLLLDPHVVQRAVCLLWVAHALERAADHCTNICERIVFLVQGDTDMPLPSEEL
jgi:phosphate transport system protein